MEVLVWLSVGALFWIPCVWISVSAHGEDEWWEGFLLGLYMGPFVIPLLALQHVFDCQGKRESRRNGANDRRV